MSDTQSYRSIRQYEIAVELAKLYYLENMSQQQIADEIGMSRSNVSRILALCQKDGIVEIRVHEAAMRVLGLKNRLIERFGLRDAIIVPRNEEDSHVLDSLCRVAAGYVQDVLTDNMTIGLGWGDTIHRLINALKPAAYLGISAVQLVGGVSMADTFKDGVQLTLDFSRKVGAAPHLLGAPLLVSSSAVRDLFLEENHARQRLDHAEGIDMAIITVGTNEPDRSALVAAGYLSRSESEALCGAGLFTHIMGQHIDRNGVPGALEFNERVVGISLDTFRRIPLRICVAGGAFKARQIAAALAGGYANVIVVDEMTALQAERFASEG